MKNICIIADLFLFVLTTKYRVEMILDQADHLISDHVEKRFHTFFGIRRSTQFPQIIHEYRDGLASLFHGD